MMRPGAKASELYARAAAMAEDASMADYFMGHRSHAGFVGHGIGIEVNEAPVLAPRSKDILIYWKCHCRRTEIRNSRHRCGRRGKYI